MSETDSWEQDKFNEVFEDELRLLNRRFESSCFCSIEELEGILHSLYIMEGQSNEGKVREISLSATIAAYEAFVHEKKRSKK
ncbi:MAG: hypothetical protein ACTTJ6_07895 [Treponema sp.]